MKTMAAAEFQATCLAVMDDVEKMHETVVITRDGKAVAKLVPMVAENSTPRPPLQAGEDPLAVFRFPGKIEIVGDIMSPAADLEDWDALR